jgi:hypothetical protein
VIRGGDFADVVARSVADDNPGKDVRIVDRGNYVRIHTAQVCRLTRCSQPQALTLCKADLPLARSNDRRRTLPSIATTP